MLLDYASSRSLWCLRKFWLIVNADRIKPLLTWSWFWLYLRTQFIFDFSNDFKANQIYSLNKFQSVVKSKIDFFKEGNWYILRLSVNSFCFNYQFLFIIKSAFLTKFKISWILMEISTLIIIVFYKILLTWL